MTAPIKRCRNCKHYESPSWCDKTMEGNRCHVPAHENMMACEYWEAEE